jgi:hypothetical protein
MALAASVGLISKSVWMKHVTGLPCALKTDDLTEIGDAGVILFVVLFWTELIHPVAYCGIGLLIRENAHFNGSNLY